MATKRVTPRELAQLLETHRKANGWTYAELGTKVGLSQRTTHRFCTAPDRTGIPVRVLDSILEYVDKHGLVLEATA